MLTGKHEGAFTATLIREEVQICRTNHGQVRNPESAKRDDDGIPADPAQGFDMHTFGV